MSLLLCVYCIIILPMVTANPQPTPQSMTPFDISASNKCIEKTKYQYKTLTRVFKTISRRCVPILDVNHIVDNVNKETLEVNTTSTNQEAFPVRVAFSSIIGGDGTSPAGFSCSELAALFSSLYPHLSETDTLTLVNAFRLLFGLQPNCYIV